jgi:hypothetical protein
MSFWLVQNLSLLYCIVVYNAFTPKGFPTSGNDRVGIILTPMQSIEEFFE